MLAIDLASTSIDRTKSFCNDCVLPINTSSFSLLVLRAATMEVTPTASDVQADRTSNGLSGLGSGTFSLGLGDRDLPRSSSSLLSITGDLLWSSWCPCSPCSKPDSPRVPGPGMVGFSTAFISVGIAEPDVPAMKFSKRRVRARCTLSDSPGEMYSLGMLCIPETRKTHADRYNNLINRRKNKNSSFSHPKVRASHLNRWFTPPIKTTLTITPRCVTHILTGNVQSITSRCFRQNEIVQTCGGLQKSIHIQLSTHVQPFTWVQNRSQWFVRTKPIDMSCSKMKTVQNSWQLKSKLLKLGFTSPNSVQSEIVQNSEISKKWMSVSTKTSKTSQSYKSTPVSAWQLSAQHFVFYTATADRPCQSLVLQPS